MRVCACVCVTQAEAQFLLMKRKAEMEQRAKEAAEKVLCHVCARVYILPLLHTHPSLFL